MVEVDVTIIVRCYPVVLSGCARAPRRRGRAAAPLATVEGSEGLASPHTRRAARCVVPRLQLEVKRQEP